jgi:putative oxidoreductase
MRLYVERLGWAYAKLDPVAYPVLRFIAGTLLIPHGSQKLFGAFDGFRAAGPAYVGGTADYFAAIGLPFPALLAYLVTGTEFFGAILIALGLFTRLAALAAAIDMLAATLIVHFTRGFFAGAGGYEYTLLLTVVFCYIAATGSGRYSLDRLFGRQI